MPVPSLLSMAIRGCIRNVTGITDVADIPYSIIKPVLKKIQNPDQLHEIETHCPQIADADAELWRAFIARDIPNWADKILEPKNPRSWWKVYRKLVRDEQRAKEGQEEELRAAMSGLNRKREENKATFVERVVPVKTRERAFVDGVRNPNVNGWGIERSPALRNAKRAKDVMNALRAQSRQAAKDRNFDAGRSAAFSTAKALPKQVIVPVVREVQRAWPAPAEPLMPRGRDPGFARQKSGSKVETALAKAEAEVARLKALTQAKRESVSPPVQPARPVVGGRAGDSIAEREARLRALTQPKPKITPAAASPPRQVTRPAISAAALPSRKRPASSMESEANGATTSSRVATNDPAATRPSPAPEMVRRRPAATSSPLIPTKRRKV